MRIFTVTNFILYTSKEKFTRIKLQKRQFKKVRISYFRVIKNVFVLMKDDFFFFAKHHFQGNAS